MADTKTEKTVADELREAAAKLRELAGAATPGPWSVGNREEIGVGIKQTGPGSFTYDALLARVYEDFEREEDVHPGCLSLGSSEADAAWIGFAHPGLAEPLASWLEDEADWLDSVPEDKRNHVIGSGMLDKALAVARVLNGTTPTAGDGSDGNARARVSETPRAGVEPSRVSR